MRPYRRFRPVTLPAQEVAAGGRQRHLPLGMLVRPATEVLAEHSPHLIGLQQQRR